MALEFIEEEKIFAEGFGYLKVSMDSIVFGCQFITFWWSLSWNYMFKANKLLGGGNTCLVLWYSGFQSYCNCCSLRAVLDIVNFAKTKVQPGCLWGFCSVPRLIKLNQKQW